MTLLLLIDTVLALRTRRDGVGRKLALSLQTPTIIASDLETSTAPLQGRTSRRTGLSGSRGRRSPGGSGGGQGTRSGSTTRPVSARRGRWHGRNRRNRVNGRATPGPRPTIRSPRQRLGWTRRNTGIRSQKRRLGGTRGRRWRIARRRSKKRRPGGRRSRRRSVTQRPTSRRRLSRGRSRAVRRSDRERRNGRNGRR
jgi:hypothetical protein